MRLLKSTYKSDEKTRKDKNTHHVSTLFPLKKMEIQCRVVLDTFQGLSLF